jgi:hypothetical protein
MVSDFASIFLGPSFLNLLRHLLSSPHTACKSLHACLLYQHIHECMPLDLPGLYYDPEKKRYFPLANRQAGAGPGSKPPVKHSRSQDRTPASPKKSSSKDNTKTQERGSSAKESARQPRPSRRPDVYTVLHHARMTPSSTSRRRDLQYVPRLIIVLRYSRVFQPDYIYPYCSEQFLPGPSNRLLTR